MSENGTPAVAPDMRGELIGRLKSKLKEFVSRNRALETERDAAVSERDAAVTRAAKAQQDYDASPLKGKVDELTGQLRERDHRTAFDRLAREKGVPDDSLDLLYQSSGYKAEQDRPDEAAIGTLLEGLKEKPGIARLFGEPGGQGGPAPGRGQGGRADDAGGKFRVTRAQARDRDFCRANQAKMTKHATEGTLELVD